jgi:hypothetical protein
VGSEEDVEEDEEEYFSGLEDSVPNIATPDGLPVTIVNGDVPWLELDDESCSDLVKTVEFTDCNGTCSSGDGVCVCS